MCFLPATLEILGTVLIAPKFFNVTIIEAAILGSVLAAVSPAVIVPRMIKLIETKKGTDKSIPQLVMAGASVDDVFVIVLFTSFLNFEKGGKFLCNYSFTSAFCYSNWNNHRISNLSNTY